MQRLSLLLLHNKHHKFYIEDDEINLETIQCPKESYKIYAGYQEKNNSTNIVFERRSPQLLFFKLSLMRKLGSWDFKNPLCLQPPSRVELAPNRSR